MADDIQQLLIGLGVNTEQFDSSINQSVDKGIQSIQRMKKPSSDAGRDAGKNFVQSFGREMSFLENVFRKYFGQVGNFMADAFQMSKQLGETKLIASPQTNKIQSSTNKAVSTTELATLGAVGGAGIEASNASIAKSYTISKNGIIDFGNAVSDTVPKVSKFASAMNFLKSALKIGGLIGAVLALVQAVGRIGSIYKEISEVSKASGIAKGELLGMYGVLDLIGITSSPFIEAMKTSGDWMVEFTNKTTKATEALEKFNLEKLKGKKGMPLTDELFRQIEAEKDPVKKLDMIQKSPFKNVEAFNERGRKLDSVETLVQVAGQAMVMPRIERKGLFTDFNPTEETKDALLSSNAKKKNQETTGTIEEQILALQSRNAELAKGNMVGEEYYANEKELSKLFDQYDKKLEERKSIIGQIEDLQRNRLSNEQQIIALQKDLIDLKNQSLWLADDEDNKRKITIQVLQVEDQIAKLNEQIATDKERQASAMERQVALQNAINDKRKWSVDELIGNDGQYLVRPFNRQGLHNLQTAWEIKNAEAWSRTYERIGMPDQAKNAQDYALKLRESAGFLSSNEQNPFANMTKGINDTAINTGKMLNALEQGKVLATPKNG